MLLGMGKTDINNLGQYFTPKNVAKHMANEVLAGTHKGGRVLDPCIGENIFFSYLDKTPLRLDGVEIDRSLITNRTQSFFSKPGRKLIVGDFIDLQFKHKFDTVIMNPPYTRQERVSLEAKKKLQTITSDSGLALSAKANLYIYFLLKGLLLLKDRGLLVAITYDSWLYSFFGTSFKQYLASNHDLKEIIHFKHDAFESVNVGATILVIRKGGRTTLTKYSEYESTNKFDRSSTSTKLHYLTPEDLINFNDHTVLRHPIKFPSSHFVTLDKISDKLPWRGTSSPANKYFLFKSSSNGLTPILKKTPVNSNSLTLKNAVYALSVNKTSHTYNSKEELERIKKELLLNGSDSLKAKVINNPYWYKFPIKPGGDIIFNYYFRNNPRFILNTDNLATMGNYYNISCSSVKYETFAILNSSLTRYALLRNSKSQGKGLRKIQLYKFNQIPVLPLEKFSGSELASLKKLGKLLTRSNKIIREIDEIVLKRYCLLVNADYTTTKSIINMDLNK